MFVWKNEYNTGIETIDNQHKKLFEIANNAYELLENSLILDKYDKIVELIHELTDYTVFHFQEEEKYMMSIGHKQFFSHKVQHEEFVKKLNSIDLTHMDDNQNKFIIDMLQFLMNWLTEHIMQKDQLYVSE